MELQHIKLEHLKVSPLNVRKSGIKNGDDLVPSIKANGIIQPLLVRPNCEGFEVVAGQRRLSALQSIAEDNSVEPVPCLVMDDGDDAKAIEASLTENIARLPMDAIDQFEAFQALVNQGKSIEAIANDFGITERLVSQRLAIANLYNPIRNAFRREEIQLGTLQVLTLATTKQQKAWFKLFKSKEEYAPTGHRLKEWLFCGADIPVSNALFESDTFKGTIITDLFGDEQYFADCEAFWEAQNIAIAERLEAYHAKGWEDVIVMDVGQYFYQWSHRTTPKKDGGKVFVEINHNGEVTFHEGYITEAEAKKRKAAEKGEDTKPERPELTKAMQSYLDLHRHAAVCAELQKNPQIALRMHLSKLIMQSVCRPQAPRSEAVAESLQANKATIERNEKREAIWEKLGIKSKLDEFDYPGMTYELLELDVHALFTTLMTLDDTDITDILAFFTCENLQSGDAFVEGIGNLLDIDMSEVWQPDEAFFDLMRDKQAINSMIKEIGGKSVADGNVSATAKVQKQIIKDCIKGENGRKAKPDWQPRYMAFPMKAYTRRGGIEAIDRFESVNPHYKAKPA